MKCKRVIGPFDFNDLSFREIAEAKGVSLSTLRRQIDKQKETELGRQAEMALQTRSAGWNPRAGNRKRVK